MITAQKTKTVRFPLEVIGVSATPPPRSHANFESRGVNSPPVSDAVAALLARLGRYHLQTVARETVNNSKGLNGCCRTLIPDLKILPGEFGSVKILKSEFGHHYGGLMTCGSVWVCPICASKITEKRRLDLSEGVQAHTLAGGGVLMLTLTVPHNYGDACQIVLDKLSDALRRMFNRGTWKGKEATIKKCASFGMAHQLGIVGRVRTLEVTHGENGWHPHFHLLLFTSRPLSALEMAQAAGVINNPECNEKTVEYQTAGLWQAACISAGLPCPNQHGCTLVDGRALADYVSKWGSVHEMTKGILKVGKKAGHYGPFALLQLVADKDKKAPALYREYAKSFVGKRQLVWSKGLRKLCGLPDIDATDEELAAQEDENASLFLNVPLNVWSVVLRDDLRGELLKACEGGIQAVYEYINNIMDDDLQEQMLIDQFGAVPVPLDSGLLY